MSQQRADAADICYAVYCGIVVSIVCRMNKVTLCRAQLVLGWVTVSGRVYHLGIKPAN